MGECGGGSGKGGQDGEREDAAHRTVVGARAGRLERSTNGYRNSGRGKRSREASR
jgi:hypothetical protein